MHSFTDRNKRTWTIDLTVSAVKRIKALVHVDLLDERQGAVVEMYAKSDSRLIDMLFAIVKPQADAAGITDEQFGDAIGGAEMGTAVLAMLEEVVDFFLGAQPPLGHAMRAILDKTTGQQAAQVEMAKRMASNPQIDQYLHQATEAAELKFTETIGSWCTKSPALSASTQDQ